MNVLSLFDGLSCGQIALNNLGIPVEKYYASEIKSHAIDATQYNFPNTIQLGDVRFLKSEILEELDIDLLLGGSPCQDLSIIKQNRKGLEGDKSALFWEYVRILKSLKPKYFLLENVASMKNIDKEIITNALGVEPILINSSVVSAQHRRRLYWTNIPINGELVDKNVLLNDIVDRDEPPQENMSDKKRAFIERKNTQFITMSNGIIRDLTLAEYQELQTIPPDYHFPCIKSKATDLIGDGWTVDVIAHILEGMLK